MLLVKPPAEIRQKRLDSDGPVLILLELESRVGGAKTSRVMGQAMRPL